MLSVKLGFPEQSNLFLRFEPLVTGVAYQDLTDLEAQTQT